MAKVKFSSLIESASGTISRRTLLDGRTETVYVTKNGHLRTIVTGKTGKREETPAQIEAKHQFATISEAVRLVCERADIPCNALARQFFSPFIKEMYYQLPENRDKEKDGETLCEMFCGRFSK